MFKKALIASATAGLIAAGTLAATTGTASAHQRGYGFQLGNSGIYFNYGPRAHPHRQYRQPWQYRQTWQYRQPQRYRQPQQYRQPSQYGQTWQYRQHRQYRQPRQYRQARSWQVNGGRNSGFSFSYGW